MAKLVYFVCSPTLLLGWRLKNEKFGVQTGKYENVEILRKSPNWPIKAKSSGGGGRVFFMTNDQLCLFPMLSYGNKNTVGAVARLFLFDPPLKPHANIEVTKSPSESDVSIFGIFVGSIFEYEYSNWQRFFLYL